MAAVDLGNGTTLTFVTSAFTAEITELQVSGIAREAINVTHLGVTPAGAGKFGSHKFLPAKNVDPGEIRATIHFNPDKLPPVGLAPETMRITFPLPAGLATPAKWEGSGFCTSFEAGIPLDDKMTGTVVLKLTGEQTVTPAA